jgi:voltage-gated potassium channel
MEKMSLRKRLYQILQEPQPGDRLAKAINTFLITLILINVICIILESVPKIDNRYRSLFILIEVVSVALFTVEYLLRIYACKEDSRYVGQGGRFKFSLSGLQLIDLLAILSFYLPLLSNSLEIFRIFRIFRVFRIFRIFRLIKLARYSDSLQLLGKVVAGRRRELIMVFSMFLIAVVLASTLVFYAERSAQPDKFTSIPAAMYWAVVTMATVGYGDVTPVTAAGKFLTTLVALTGILALAMPTAIIGSGFMEELGERREKLICPHCGKEIDSE